MIPQDRRFHETRIDQLRFTPRVFSSVQGCSRLLERARLDLVQLLAFDRINCDEYEEVNEEHANLAAIYPIQDDE